jgi:hypothetical protein
MFMINLANSGCDTLCFLGTLEIRHALECGYGERQWLERRLWAATQWFINSHDAIYGYIANDANVDMPTCGELARAIDRHGQKRWDFWKLQLRILQKKGRRPKYWQDPETEDLVDGAALAESRAWMDREREAAAPIDIPSREP